MHVPMSGGALKIPLQGAGGLSFVGDLRHAPQQGCVRPEVLRVPGGGAVARWEQE